MSSTVDELLEQARRRVAAAGSQLAPREARLILARSLGLSEAETFSRSQGRVETSRARAFLDLLDRRLKGEPFAYLFGEREFYGRRFFVDRRVLIPRPETEHLVEVALHHIDAGRRHVLDLATGSGCVAITLALERPGISVLASDIDLSALAVAQRNRRHLDAPVRLVACDLLRALRADGCDLVTANLPYVDPASRSTLTPDVRDYEPSAALFAEERGMALFRDLFRQAHQLAAGTLLLLEIGADQAADIEKLGGQYDLHPATRIADYAGRDRVLVLER